MSNFVITPDPAAIFNVGRVTSYADAVAGGYQGTREEWEIVLANLGTTAAEVEANRQAVAEDKAAVQENLTTVETYKNSAAQSASEALQSAENAHTDALAATAAKEAAQTAQGIAEEARADAVSAKGAAESAQTEANASASAATEAALAAQDAAATAAANAGAASDSATAAAESATSVSGVVAEVTAAKTEAITAIEAKGAETLDSIPDDYTELSRDVTDLKSANNNLAYNDYIEYDYRNLLVLGRAINGTVGNEWGISTTSGGISPLPPIEFPANTRVSVEMKTGYRMTCRYIQKSDNIIKLDSGWQTDNYTFVAVTGYIYGFYFARVANTGNIESIDEAINNFTIKVDSKNTTSITESNKDIYSIANLGTIKYDLAKTLSVGTITYGNVGEAPYTSFNEQRASQYPFADFGDASDVTITMNTGYRMSMRTISKTTGLCVAVDTEWKSGTYNFTSNGECVYSFLFRRVQGTTQKDVTRQQILDNVTIAYTPKITKLINNFASSDVFVNVKDFGALGNGTADDTQAIQDALESVKITGGTVFIPSGTYMLKTVLFNAGTNTAAALHIYNNTTLWLDSGAVIKRGAAAVTHPIFTHNETDATGYNGAKNIVIKGGKFDENSSLGGYCTSINLSHGDGITIDGVEFINGSSNWHYIECNSSNDVFITNCRFLSGTSSEDIQLDAAVGGGNLGESDNTVDQNIEIANCYFNSGAHAAIGNHTNAAHHDIRIHDNVFYNSNADGAIKMVALTHDVDIYNNTFYANTYAANFAASQTSSMFHDNRLYDVTTPVRNCTAYDNVIDGVFTRGNV